MQKLGDMNSIWLFSRQSDFKKLTISQKKTKTKILIKFYNLW